MLSWLGRNPPVPTLDVRSIGKMEEKISFTIVYEQDVHDGWYTASIKEVPGCHSQGFNKHSARENVLEALTLFPEWFEGLVGRDG